MKIITYSDLHLEFGTEFAPPLDSDADLLILAGDIITFSDFTPLQKAFEQWQKPILFVAGNHEYYGMRPVDAENNKFKTWLQESYPQVVFLQDEAVTISGVNFFGGTMWTNFNNSNISSMLIAENQMNDFRRIVTAQGAILKPEDTVIWHNQFVSKLCNWFEQDLAGARVVISHHAPTINPKTNYRHSPLSPAFNSLDMVEIIEKYQPDLWLYGHTHECDNHMIGKTKIISNQRGYPRNFGGFECDGYDENGAAVVVNHAVI